MRIFLIYYFLLISTNLVFAQIKPTDLDLKYEKVSDTEVRVITPKDETIDIVSTKKQIQHLQDLNAVNNKKILELQTLLNEAKKIGVQ